MAYDKKAVRAVRRNRALVRYGPDAYFFSLTRLLPLWLIEPLLGRLMGRRGLEIVKRPALPADGD